MLCELVGGQLGILVPAGLGDSHRSHCLEILALLQLTGAQLTNSAPAQELLWALSLSVVVEHAYFWGKNCSLTPSSQNKYLGNGLLPQLLDGPDLLSSRAEVSWLSSAVQGPVYRRMFAFYRESVRWVFSLLITLRQKSLSIPRSTPVLLKIPVGSRTEFACHAAQGLSAA